MPIQVRNHSFERKQFFFFQWTPTIAATEICKQNLLSRKEIGFDAWDKNAAERILVWKSWCTARKSTYSSPESMLAVFHAQSMHSILNIIPIAVCYQTMTQCCRWWPENCIAFSLQLIYSAVPSNQTNSLWARRRERKCFQVFSHNCICLWLCVVSVTQPRTVSMHHYSWSVVCWSNCQALASPSCTGIA